MQKETLTFKDFPLDSSIQDALDDLNYKTPTPIQAKTLPLTLKGHDVMGTAQTGTGKTAAFSIAMLHYLMTNPVHPNAKGPWAIVLAPTRELALQIKKDLSALSKYTGLNSLAIYGGVSIEQQKKLFASAPIDIIVGTPGRIIDLYKQKTFRLKNIEVCVLDEADRMFDLGFIDDVRYLLRQMPKASERLNLLFSATMPHKVQELAYEHFNAPQNISIENAQPTADNIQQTLYHTAKDEKIPLLIGLLQQEKAPRSIIFVNTKKELEHLSLTLKENGYDNVALSGDLPQKKREQAIEDFQKGKHNLIVATDVAARGLHIPDISHVFNYDLPQIAEDYVHRIGRTARAGQSGTAISFACEEYVYSLPDIEDYIQNKIPKSPIKEEQLAKIKHITEKQTPRNRQKTHRRNNPNRRRDNSPKPTP